MCSIRRFTLVCVTLVVAFVAVGCAPAGSSAMQKSGSAAKEPPPTLSPAEIAIAPEGPTLGESQRAGDVRGWLSSAPLQPVVGTSDMDLFLIDANQNPITDARVTFDTDMTNMSHGEYLVEATPTGNGHYHGPIHYSMRGPWRVIAVVERPGHETTNLRFDFRVTTE